MTILQIPTEEAILASITQSLKGYSSIRTEEERNKTENTEFDLQYHLLMMDMKQDFKDESIVITYRDGQNYDEVNRNFFLMLTLYKTGLHKKIKDAHDLDVCFDTIETIFSSDNNFMHALNGVISERREYSTKEEKTREEAISAVTGSTKGFRDEIISNLFNGAYLDSLVHNAFKQYPTSIQISGCIL